ncbi:uncharacterized protein LOC136063396 [Quercus suber]|uniref:uncharacterized protein LOC136063396 n=1 Tax=Quercus suber TaxID=58331 RepID=UPI0032E04887
MGLEMEVQKRPSIEEISTFAIQSTSSWMTSIISFFQDGHLPQDVKEARKVRKRAARFTILNDTLYKKGFSMPFLKCVDEEEAKYILEKIHERVCRDHVGPKSLIKVTNQILLKIIKAKLDEAKRAWLEELPNVLWAYRTIARTLTGEISFRLTYGIEVVIPVEVGISSNRQEMFHEDSNDDQLRVNLDCLDEVRDGAANKMTKYQQKMVDYYNKRVKLRRLDVGDLVLRKVTLATRDPAQGKLGLTWEGPYRVVHYSRQGNYHLETLDG